MNKKQPTVNTSDVLQKVKATKFDDLDALCLFVQDTIGLSDGGNAGLFWANTHADGIAMLHQESGSDNILDSIPDDILSEYIESEISALDG